MANDYDRIFKENIESLLPFLLQRILGWKVKKWENISTDLPLTIERKPDFLKKVFPLDSKENPYLLHIEFQTNIDTKMPFRMLEYYGLLYNKHKLPIQQIVLNLSKPKPLITEIIHENLQFRFKNIFIQSYDYQLFIESKIPEEIILSLLANFGNVAPQKVLKRIVERLLDLEEGKISKRFEQKYANQLFVLSRIRNLEDETFKLLETMPLHYNIETDFLYKKGMQKGIEEGIEKEKIIFAKNLLKETSFSDEKIATLVGISEEETKEIRKQLKS